MGRPAQALQVADHEAVGPPLGDLLQRVSEPRAVEGPSVLAVADDLEEVPGGVLARRLDGGRRSFVLV